MESVGSRSVEDRAEEAIPADIRMISGCEDAQTSGDIQDVANFKLPDPAGRAGGACTSGLLQVLYADHTDTSADLTFEEVLLKLRDNLDDMGLSQIPQLSSSKVMNMEQLFHIVPEGCTGTRRAVMIGINYTGQDGELSGCQNDVKNMLEYLKDVHGFQDENITLLLDDDEHKEPTRHNILRAFEQLVKDSKPGDVVFVHFSGHGGKVRDFDGDEADGYDETLIPVDFEKCGQIRDDQLYGKLVCPMSAGVTMTCIFDCCHSGTVLDLPYVFMADGQQDGMGLLESFDEDKLDQVVSCANSDDGAVASDDGAVASDDGLVAPDPAPTRPPPARPSKTPPTPSAANDGPPERPVGPSGEMQEVFVKFNSESIVINADCDDKFVEVKKALEEHTGVALKDQHLIYNGLNIKFADDKSLRYYGCQGGCFMTLTDLSKKQ